LQKKIQKEANFRKSINPKRATRVKKTGTQNEALRETDLKLC
jgi:hypothetical protein